MQLIFRHSLAFVTATLTYDGNDKRTPPERFEVEIGERSGLHGA